MVKYIYTVNILFVSKTSSRHVFKTSSRRLQDVFSVTIFCIKTSCEMSSRRLGRRKIVTLKTCWRRLQDMSSRRLQDVLKTNKCLLGWHFNCVVTWQIKNILSSLSQGTRSTNLAWLGWEDPTQHVICHLVHAVVKNI